MDTPLQIYRLPHFDPHTASRVTEFLRGEPPTTDLGDVLPTSLSNLPTVRVSARGVITHGIIANDYASRRRALFVRGPELPDELSLSREINHSTYPTPVIVTANGKLSSYVLNSGQDGKELLNYAYSRISGPVELFIGPEEEIVLTDKDGNTTTTAATQDQLQYWLDMSINDNRIFPLTFIYSDRAQRSFANTTNRLGVSYLGDLLNLGVEQIIKEFGYEYLRRVNSMIATLTGGALGFGLTVQGWQRPTIYL